MLARVELSRLDDLRDSIFLAFVALARGDVTSREQLDKINLDRGRLGTNLTRLRFDAGHYEQVRRGLEQLSDVILTLEDAIGGEPTPTEAEIDGVVDYLRRSIVAAARQKSVVFRFLGA